jgi:O-antigen ligase
LYERLSAWTYYIDILKSIGMNQLMFGLGWVQNSKLEAVNTAIPMDDLYITIAIHIGLIGLVLYLFFAWSLWRELLKSVEREPSYLQIAVAATYSTFFLMGVFNNVPTSLPLYFLLVAMTLKYVNSRNNAAPAMKPAKGEVVALPKRSGRRFLGIER